MKKKLKPLLPTLRERKRYLAFEIISKKHIKSFSEVSDAIWQSALSFMGELGTAKAGIWLLPDKYSAKKQKGIIRVNHKNVDNLKASLTLIEKIGGQEAIVRSLGVSGVLNKALKYAS